MQVIRYFHLRGHSPNGWATHGGVCVKVTGNTDDPAQVDVQYAVCSKKDPYTKAIGRSQASKAPIKVVMLRYLPNELARLRKLVADNHYYEGTKIYEIAAFHYSIPYFLPKE